MVLERAVLLALAAVLALLLGAEWLLGLPLGGHRQAQCC